MAPANDDVIYIGSPVMFRSQPVRFLVSSALIPVIYGAVDLARWWLQCRSTRLIITPVKTTLRNGLLSRELSEVQHANIRNVQLRQTFFQRLMNVGSIGISSSGQGGVEIEIDGIRDPMRVKSLIESGQKPAGAAVVDGFDWLPAAALSASLATSFLLGVVALDFASRLWKQAQVDIAKAAPPAAAPTRGAADQPAGPGRPVANDPANPQVRPPEADPGPDGAAVNLEPAQSPVPIPVDDSKNATAARKLALAKPFLDRGDTTVARKRLQEIIDQFDGTPAAGEARELLKSVD